MSENKNELDQRLAEEFQFDKHAKEADQLHSIPEQMKFWANKKREFNSIGREYDSFGMQLSVMRIKHRVYFQKVDDQIAYLKELLPIEEYHSYKKAPQLESPGALVATENKWPDPYKECFNYYPETGASVKKFKGKELEIIAPVMKETLSYIESKGEPRIKSIDGHVQAIRDRCNGIPAGKDAKNGFINFIAKKAGLKLSPINEERFSKI